MVIITNKSGRLGNRLFHFANFIASSMAHGYRLINPCFDEYASLFDATEMNLFGSYPISIRWTPSWFTDRLIARTFDTFSYIFPSRFYPIGTIVLHNIHQFDREGRDFNLNDPGFLSIASSQMVFVSGWRYRDQVNFSKYADKIKTFFTPKEPLQQKISSRISICREQGDVLIGIHIRRDDYRSFYKGAWYYSLEVYLQKMISFKNLMEEQGKKCVFLVCSSEPIESGYFKDMIVHYQRDIPVIDLYTLAGCDYLIGPPSTFSLWASFYGAVPLMMLHTDDIPVELYRFAVCTSL